MSKNVYRLDEKQNALPIERVPAKSSKTFIFALLHKQKSPERCCSIAQGHKPGCAITGFIFPTGNNDSFLQLPYCGSMNRTCVRGLIARCANHYTIPRKSPRRKGVNCMGLPCKVARSKHAIYTRFIQTCQQRRTILSPQFLPRKHRARSATHWHIAQDRHSLPSPPVRAYHTIRVTKSAARLSQFSLHSAVRTLSGRGQRSQASSAWSICSSRSACPFAASSTASPARFTAS